MSSEEQKQVPIRFGAFIVGSGNEQTPKAILDMTIDAIRALSVNDIDNATTNNQSENK